MFLQTHQERDAMEKKINDFHKTLDALHDKEAELREFDEEIDRAEKGLIAVTQKRAEIVQRIEALINDPDMAIKHIEKLEEQKEGLGAQIARRGRAAAMLKLRREEKAFELAEAIRAAGWQRKEVIRPYARARLDQQLEAMGDLLDALALNRPFAPLDGYENPEESMAKIVYRWVLNRLPGHRANFQNDPILSKIKYVPKVDLPNLPDISSPVRTLKRKQSIKEERKRLILQAAGPGVE